MTQRPLFQQRAIARGVERKKVKMYTDREKHDANNRIAAAVILADAEKYERECPALLLWATVWTARMEAQ